MSRRDEIKIKPGVYLMRRLAPQVRKQVRTMPTPQAVDILMDRGLHRGQVNTIISYLHMIKLRRQELRHQRELRQRLLALQNAPRPNLLERANQRGSNTAIKALKIGRDQYSEMSYQTLLGLVSAADQQAVCTVLPDATEAELAGAYRWILRGLRADLAGRKMNLNRQVASAMSRPRRELTDEEFSQRIWERNH